MQPRTPTEKKGEGGGRDGAEARTGGKGGKEGVEYSARKEKERIEKAIVEEEGEADHERFFLAPVSGCSVM